MDIKNAEKAIGYVNKLGRTLNIIGKHGIGKSSIVYQYAMKHGYEVLEIRLGQMADAGDLIGLQEFLLDPTTKLPFATRHVLPEWFPRTGKTKKILFLDELNRAPKDIQQAIFELVYDKRLKGVPMGEDCHIISACNPATENYSVMDFDDCAFQDRFVHVVLSPTKDEFLSYARSKKLDSSVLDFLQDYPKMMEDSSLTEPTLDFVKPSRRSWEAVAKLRQIVPESDNSLFLELTMGLVGEAPALAYKSFSDTYVSNITAKDVLERYPEIVEKHKQLTAKGRNDIIANVLDDIKTDFTARSANNVGLSTVEADNLEDFIQNLNPEEAMTLAIIVKDTRCALYVDGRPGGLFESEKFVKAIKKAKKLQKEASDKIEKIKQNKTV